MSINAIRGFNDILPGESELFRWIETEAYRVFSLYGYSEIKVPVLEKTELFSRSIGETTDIVEKEMYTFTDRRGDSLTMRPEGTAPVVRAYIQHKLYATPVQKLYYTGPMFRYERPQKGRYRQFYQIGAEILGDASPGADAEAISMLMEYFACLGVQGASLQINSLGCGECRPAYKERLLKFLEGRRERLCENCDRRIENNPLRALDCKRHGCIEATADAPSIMDTLCQGCSDHFSEVEKRLKLLKMDFTVNPRMVRGLDYYTKTTFEIVSGSLGSQNAIAAGGRYDGLVEGLGGPSTPCIGFAIGVERLSLILKERGFEQTPLVAFIALGTEEAAIDVVSNLRDVGIRVFEDFSTGPLKKRMKTADKLGASYAVILGEDELNEGCATVKDMASAAQVRVPLAELAGWLKGAR